MYIGVVGSALGRNLRGMGSSRILKGGASAPGIGSTLEATYSCRSRIWFALKGPITTPIGAGFRSVNVALRQTLDLYACLRPCKSYAGVLSRYSDVDLVIVRENTEGLYCGIEFEKGTGGLDKIIALVKENEGKEIDKNSGVSLFVWYSYIPIAVEILRRFCLERARL